ncbi:MAG: class I SAM-dependent methyltransferase [Candidatus Hydrogenedentes bacterium]|nr:class I SAM-dependent methyltransferase [Candidatus Hydrogenedentota bacterium]
MAQEKQSKWLEQWKAFRDEELFLFEEWISPNKLEDFRGKTVLEAGCGGGQHTSFVAPYCKRIVAVDLNAVEVAAERNSDLTNVQFLEADIAVMDLQENFDVVFSIGVVHHTDSPDSTVANLVRHLKQNGRLILWVYSKEGNWIAEFLIERLRRIALRNASTRALLLISKILTSVLYLPIYSLYLFPLQMLPYYEYFSNFRRLSFERNVLNVFDKLNAPQVEFISESRVRGWFPPEKFRNVHISSYKGVSWRASGIYTHTDDLSK